MILSVPFCPLPFRPRTISMKYKHSQRKLFIFSRCREAILEINKKHDSRMTMSEVGWPDFSYAIPGRYPCTPSGHSPRIFPPDAPTFSSPGHFPHDNFPGHIQGHDISHFSCWLPECVSHSIGWHTGAEEERLLGSSWTSRMSSIDNQFKLLESRLGVIHLWRPQKSQVFTPPLPCPHASLEMASTMTYRT